MLIEARPALTSEQQEVWDERVAICVFDGGLTKAEAEVVASAQIRREFGIAAAAGPLTSPHVASHAATYTVTPPPPPSAPPVAGVGLSATPRSNEEQHHGH